MGFVQRFISRSEEHTANKLKKQLAKDHERFLKLAKQDHEKAQQAALTILGYYEVNMDGRALTAEDLPNLSTAELLEICEYGIEQLRRLK